jgi:hypothetical protein
MVKVFVVEIREGAALDLRLIAGLFHEMQRIDQSFFSRTIVINDGLHCYNLLQS